jgi:hypothetical protein
MDYSTLRPGTLRLLPLPRQLDAWEKDYLNMRGTMFFGETPDFDEILHVVGDFQRAFNAGKTEI